MRESQPGIQVMPPLSLKSVIPAVLADWYQMYLSGYAAPRGRLTSPNSCPVPRKSPAGILSTRVFISINMGVCTREGARLLGSLISRCMLLTDKKALQTNKKQVAIKLQDYLLVWHREGNHWNQMIHKETGNVTTKHKKVLISVKQKEITRRETTSASNTTDKRVISKHHTDWLRKTASL